MTRGLNFYVILILVDKDFQTALPANQKPYLAIFANGHWFSHGNFLLIQAPEWYWRSIFDVKKLNGMVISWPWKNRCAWHWEERISIAFSLSFEIHEVQIYIFIDVCRCFYVFNVMYECYFRGHILMICKLDNLILRNITVPVNINQEKIIACLTDNLLRTIPDMIFWISFPSEIRNENHKR